MRSHIERVAFGVFVVALAFIAAGLAYIGFEVLVFMLRRLAANIMERDFISIAFGFVLLGVAMASCAVMVAAAVGKKAKKDTAS